HSTGDDPDDRRAPARAGLVDVESLVPGFPSVKNSRLSPGLLRWESQTERAPRHSSCPAETAWHRVETASHPPEIGDGHHQHWPEPAAASRSPRRPVGRMWLEPGTRIHGRMRNRTATRCRQESRASSPGKSTKDGGGRSRSGDEWGSPVRY